MKDRLILGLLSIIGCVCVVNLVYSVWVAPRFHQVQTALQSIPPAVTYQQGIGGSPVGAQCSVHHTHCAQALLTVINADRARLGRSPLHLDWTLTKGTASCSGALAHAKAMAASGSIWHQNPSYPAESFPNDVCEQTTASGQNAGLAFGDEFSALIIDYQQMYAEGVTGGHYQNLMGEGAIPSLFTRVGIGIAYQNGAVYVIETFAA